MTNSDGHFIVLMAFDVRPLVVCMATPCCTELNITHTEYQRWSECSAWWLYTHDLLTTNPTKKEPISSHHPRFLPGFFWRPPGRKMPNVWWQVRFGGPGVYHTGICQALIHSLLASLIAMTAYLTFTHYDSRRLIATPHLPRVQRAGRPITNLSGRLGREDKFYAWREISASTGEYGVWHECYASSVTDDSSSPPSLHHHHLSNPPHLLPFRQAGLNGRRRGSWLGPYQGRSGASHFFFLLHFASLRGTDIKADHRGFSGPPVSRIWRNAAGGYERRVAREERGWWWWWGVCGTSKITTTLKLFRDERGQIRPHTSCVTGDWKHPVQL